MMRTSVLVVEDDNSIRNLMAATLQVHGYNYFTANNGANAIREAVDHNPDVIFLDLGLPDMDGIEVIKKIRGWSNVPIIVISARGEDSDKIEALDSGADDYLTKPFSIEELLARLRVAERRMNMVKDNNEEGAVFKNGALEINYAANCTYINGSEIHLTQIEYKLLCLLAKHIGKVLTHSFIMKNVWESSWDNDIASLRVFMTTLRRKLERAGSNEQYIQTHVGVGYRMIKVEEKN